MNKFCRALLAVCLLINVTPEDALVPRSVKVGTALLCHGAGSIAALYCAIKGLETAVGIDSAIKALDPIDRLNISSYTITIIQNCEDNRLAAITHSLLAGGIAAAASYAGWQLSKQVILEDARREQEKALAQERAKAQKR